MHPFPWSVHTYTSLSLTVFCPHFLCPAFFPSHYRKPPSIPHLLVCSHVSIQFHLSHSALCDLIWILLLHLLFSLAGVLSLHLVALIDGISIHALAMHLLFLLVSFLRSRSIFLISHLNHWCPFCLFRIYFSVVAHLLLFHCHLLRLLYIALSSHS